MREIMNLDFSAVKILVIGDPMIDWYHFGYVDRISPEAPVPVFIEDRYEKRLGGAANVWSQLMHLGCQAYAGYTLESNHWTAKHRYMVGNHQLLRIDEDRCVISPIPALEGFSAVVISDYAKGACTTEVCLKVITEARKLSIPVIVDPKGKDWTKYSRATLLCPNSKEYAEGEAQSTVRLMGCQILEKRSADGLRLHARVLGDPYQDFPAQVHHLADVTGAGDIVTAVIAACMGAKIDLQTACGLANLAAGHVVSEVGTSVCPIDKLRELCINMQ